MKAFACVLLIVAVAVAEPVSRYRQNYRFARQETEGGQEPTTARTDDAPYPAAGFRPDIEFKLPSQQEVAPPFTTYGVPDTSYGPPAVEYGPPEIPTTEEPTTETTESLQVEGLTKENVQEEPKGEAEVVSNQGAYYVLLPGSQLQRVQFQTENDLSNMAYTARLQYKDEDRAPLYVYTSVPQYQTSAALVQVSGALVQPSNAYQPSAANQPSAVYQPSAAYQSSAFYQPSIAYQPSSAYLAPSAAYRQPSASYYQAW